MNLKSKTGQIYEVFLLLFIFSLFLTLGSDRADLLGWRMAFGATLIAAGVVVVRQSRKPVEISTGSEMAEPPRKDKRRIPLVLLSVFFLYEILRAAGAFLMLRFSGAAPEVQPVLQAIAASPRTWFFYWGFFGLSYFFFSKKTRVWHLMNTLAWAGFFLALNAIPPLLLHGKPGYVHGNDWFFFFPVFYFHPGIEKYIAGIFAHLNYVGDVIAFGFFGAAGILFYTFHALRDSVRHSERSSGSGPSGAEAWAFLFLRLTQALVTSAAIVLLFSRGTISFLGLSFLLFFLGLVMKYPGKAQWGFAGLIAVGTIAFLAWAGNLQSAVKELGTLQEESASDHSSLAHNTEGAHRALEIYKAFPVFGVGTGGYGLVAKKYASPDTERLALVDYQSMCHYLQILAEEGAGAFLYFLFLLVYGAETVWGLFRTKSRFKFAAALSFFSIVLMILGHAAINHLMQRFPIALLVSICMGAGLAVLRDDFQHD